MTARSSEHEMVSWTHIVEQILSYLYDILQNVFATENFKLDVWNNMVLALT